MTISQKAFAIVFIVVAVIAAGSIMVSRMSNNSSNASPSPSASVDPELFPTNQQQSNSQSSQTQPPAQRQIKQYASPPPTLATAELEGKKAVIVTNKGTIEFEIYPDSPKTASNFIFLANNKFYDGLKFHRVEPGFVIQGGDPLGNGQGGPGYKFEDEPVTKKYNKGIVAMANAGPNTNGSQFFIMLEDNPTLPPNYTIFGQVTSGQEVVDSIKVGDVMQSVTIQELQ